MGMNEILSVVIPIYNVEKYLPQCIESVINQTYRELEIILVDDGSDDLSAEICDRYARKDDRIKVIHKKNGGLISARYKGVEAAEADYVIFVDGDDWVAPDMYLELMRDIVESQADLVTSGCIRYYSSEYQKIDKDMYVPTGLHDRESIVKNIIPIMMRCGETHYWGLDPSTCLKIFRRKLLMRQLESLKEHKFYFGEDSAIVYPYILQAEKICCTRKVFYYHRQREQEVLAPYITEEDCIERLSEFYSYMKHIFMQTEYRESLMRQLDFLYMDMVTHRQKKYGITDYLGRKDYHFPFTKVQENSRVVLYGAGKVGNAYYHQLKEAEGYEVVLWVDRSYEKYKKEVVPPSQIQDICYDYVVIAAVSPNIIAEIHDELRKMGVEEDRIIYGGHSEIFFE